MQGTKFIKTRQNYIDKVRHITKDLPVDESQRYIDLMYDVFDKQLDPNRIGDFSVLYPHILLNWIQGKVTHDEKP